MQKKTCKHNIARPAAALHHSRDSKIIRKPILYIFSISKEPILTSFLHSHHPDFQPQNTPVEAHFLGSFGPLLQRCQTLCAQAHLLHNTKAKHIVNIPSCIPIKF